MEFEQKLDDWLLVIKQSLITEYSQFKTDYANKLDLEYTGILLEKDVEIKRLVEEIAKLNSDKLALKVKLDSRMKLINKSQIHVNKQLLRLDLKSLFHQWKLKLELKNATDISTRLARKQYSRLLMKKCLEAWKLSSQSNAKQIMERSIRREFEYQLALQQSEHIKETQKVLLINKLSERIKQLETDYQKVEMLREAQQEELRIKFLRGVSALNQEAMGMFRQKPIRTEPVPVPRSSVVKDLKDPPNRAIHEPTMITNTNGLVTRHFVKK